MKVSGKVPQVILDTIVCQKILDDQREKKKTNNKNITGGCFGI